MAHAVAEEKPLHMGLPISNGKLAMWLFLVTEIMFFTGLIGTYIVLRNGSRFWPTPHMVHLEEYLGAINTFVLICSSLTVVLAHSAIAKGNVKTTLYYMVVTLALGGVFLGIKAVEYAAKFEHHILPGQIHWDRYDGERGLEYRRHLREELEKIEKESKDKGVKDAKTGDSLFLLEVIRTLDKREPLNTAQLDGIGGFLSDKAAEPDIRWDQVRGRFEQGKASSIDQIQTISNVAYVLDHKYHTEGLDLAYVMPQGNTWVSCYFIMTGFHAIHVLGGLVVFVLILVLGALGRIGTHSTSMIELTGLYWHFVDIVWIFLFPLLYLV